MNYLVQFGNVFYTKGIARGLLIDPVRNIVEFIPNDIIDFIKSGQGQDIIDFKHSNERFKDVFDEYLDYLISNEFCFISKLEPFVFNKTIDFFIPISIDNGIIVLSKNISKKMFDDFCVQILELDSKVLEIQIFYEIDNLFNIISSLRTYNFDSISIIYNLEGSKKDINYKAFVEIFKNTKSKIVINFISDGIENENISLNNLFIKFNKRSKLYIKNCGNIRRSNFTTSLNVVREAHHHNTCLNRKISIDAEGNIRNCPSMPQSFGNIKDTTLPEALDHPDFKKYWNHKKDDIEVCRDCEFRYICTDCRAYLEDPHNEYSKPLKCGYDPYTGEWSEWSTNPLKQAAIRYYGMEKIINIKQQIEKSKI